MSVDTWINSLADQNCLILPYPVSTNRYYRTFRNITSLSKEGKAYKSTVKMVYPHLKPTLDNYGLTIFIHPKLKKDGSSFKLVVDIDNALKCILDSLIGIIYHDDKQVKELSVKYGMAVIGGAATVGIQIIPEGVW